MRACWLAHSLALMALALSTGCATEQVVPVSLEPASAQLYVDGEPVATPVSELRLRSDRAHVVLAKRPGYRSKQVVIESVRDAGGAVLVPGALDLRLEPLVERGRSVEVGFDEEDENAGGAGPAAATEEIEESPSHE